MNVSPTPEASNLWQLLKREWKEAVEADRKVQVSLRILYDPSAPEKPAGLEVRYQIDDDSFTRTFRGIPEGYDVADRIS